jgi:hypothetical protein
MRTNAGLDYQAGIMGNQVSTGTGAFASACWLGVTADTGTPVATDVTLTAEVTSGTLARGQTVYAHTNGTNFYTQTRVLTSDQTIVLAKAALFNAASSGTMVFEQLLNAPVSMVSGDQVAITTTISL